MYCIGKKSIPDGVKIFVEVFRTSQTKLESLMR